MSYQLTSRSGNESVFAEMVRHCHEHEVDIYADVVLNPMAGGKYSHLCLDLLKEAASAITRLIDAYSCYKLIHFNRWVTPRRGKKLQHMAPQ